MKKTTAAIIGLALVAGVINSPAQGWTNAPTAFDGSKWTDFAQLDPTNYTYQVWHPLFGEGQTSNAARMAHLDGLTPTNTHQFNVVQTAKAYVEAKQGNLDAALAHANRIEEEMTKATTTLRVYIAANQPEGYATFCENYLQNDSGKRGAGDAKVMVALRYCRYLALHGDQKEKRSNIAKAALESSIISRAGSAKALFGNIRPALYPTTEYKEFLAKAIANCAVTEGNVPYLSKLKSAHEVLP